jgi:hypothetical protein
MGLLCLTNLASPSTSDFAEPPIQSIKGELDGDEPEGD